MASPSEFTKIVPQQTFFFLQKFKSMKSDTFGPNCSLSSKQQTLTEVLKVGK